MYPLASNSHSFFNSRLLPIPVRIKQGTYWRACRRFQVLRTFILSYKNYAVKSTMITTTIAAYSANPMT